MAELSEHIGLSLSACHRRVKLLEKSGVIRHYAAVLDRRSLGLEVQVFIEVKLTSQRTEEFNAFEEAIAAMPEVLESHMITGEFDYLMRVAVSNTAAYDELLRNKLSQIPSVTQMRTLLSLSSVKEFDGYHL
ncbi:MAG: Transcriptional regulator, AsnC family [Olavius algarvensis Gamma 3 endosymbiont]|nr:MAG: Transcriptional regulator, AsnC family [Olavius algarvensis Gamma 3 endosymbiont]